MICLLLHGSDISRFSLQYQPPGGRGVTANCRLIYTGRGRKPTELLPAAARAANPPGRRRHCAGHEFPGHCHGSLSVFKRAVCQLMDRVAGDEFGLFLK